MAEYTIQQWRTSQNVNPKGYGYREMNMKKTQKHFVKILKMLEYTVAVALIVAMIVSLISFVIHQSAVFSIEDFQLETYLSFALSLIVGVEFVKMLVLQTPGSLVEVVMFAVARQIIMSHDNALENLIGVIAVVLMFICRKYLLGEGNKLFRNE